MMPEKQKKKPNHRPRENPAKKTERNIAINPFALEACIEVLNAAALFQGRIKFTRIWRTGTVIHAEFANGRTAEWFSATDLITFAKSQAILFDATDFLIPTPTRRTVTETWEPIAQLIRNIASQNAIDLPHALKDEFEGILRSTWIRSGGGDNITQNREEFFAVLKESQTGGRKLVDRPPRSCVWAGGDGEDAEHFCWVHLDSLSEWLSTQRGKGRHYPWDDIRKALLMLGFKARQLHITITKERVNVRVWKGPIDVLTDDDTKPESVIG